MLARMRKTKSSLKEIPVKVIPIVWTAVVCALPVPVRAASCESLAFLSLPGAKITMAQIVSAGAFSPPGGGQADAYKSVPEFCRVAATLTPSSDSDIKVEVWLPVAGWNQKFQAVGNGGWAGVISYSAMAEAVKSRYATASTDTGHSSKGGSFALGHPEKLIDFAWRSEHEMTVKAKSIILAFYGNAQQRSYWNGCSTGGRQGLKEAQMFPDDFDGIIVGAPANRNVQKFWIAHALLRDPASCLPPAKFPLINKAVLDACDARDGLKDGLIEDPTRCKFDPGVLLCKDADGPDCLTAPQVEAVRKVYTPGRNPRTGKELCGPLAPGSELGWAVLCEGLEAYDAIFDQMKYVVLKDSAWDWRTFDFDRDVARFELPENLIMNATDPNLGKFFAHGGKMLIYHGWSDQLLSPYTTIEYFKSVQHTLGGASKTANDVRLFMVPGMMHCSGGEGPDTFDKVGTLDRWVEEGKPPDLITASHRTDGKVDRTRPLCPYPQVAKYKGTGSIDDAASFVCE
jgi:tannase/feruloyl esterase